MLNRHVHAAVPVSDLARADAWYEALFGFPATNRPMPSLVEWQVPGTGWVQVHVDPEHAGGTALNLAVDDLDGARAEIAARGIELGEVIEANKGVVLSPLLDPDGNRITMIGGFREVY
jgi:predicted enzyme related to lactoylglutathione lyase